MVVLFLSMVSEETFQKNSKKHFVGSKGNSLETRYMPLDDYS